jgi:dTDP-4-dehydrorhamnose reductase
MRLLLLGAGGQLGQEITAAVTDIDLIGRTRAQTDTFRPTTYSMEQSRRRTSKPTRPRRSVSTALQSSPASKPCASATKNT